MSRRPPDGAETSTLYGRIPLTVFLQLWSRPETLRFRYRPIRLVPGLMLVTLAGLWAYYLYSVLAGPGLTLPLVIFGAVLVTLSGWSVLRLLVWRLFVRRSGVAVTKEALVWRQGPLCFLAPWSQIGPEALGLERLAFDKNYESYLNVQIGETREPLYLVRLYARLEDVEGLLAELLERIPRDKWERAAELVRRGEQQSTAKSKSKPRTKDKE
jgi:hypothetical protein